MTKAERMSSVIREFQSICLERDFKEKEAVKWPFQRERSSDKTMV